MLAADSARGAAPDLSEVTRPGANIQRSMKRMEESTAQKRNTVRILFYGQSITRQNWWPIVADHLRSTYPHANLIIENRAIGGFQAPTLIQTAEFDLYPFYPDLLVFHVYGGGGDAMDRWEEIIRRTRTRTAAEILLWTHHDVGRERDYLESERIRQIAVKYDCGLVDVMHQWQKLLAERNLPPKALLSSGPHLNPKGCELLAGMIIPFLRYDPQRMTDQSRKLVTAVPWDDRGRVRRLPDGSVELTFTGNRIDAVASPSAGLMPLAEVLIDGRKPSTFPKLYVLTRPSNAPFDSLRPALKRIGHREPLVEEDWTLEIVESTPDGTRFRFRARGSVTGDDGEGTNTERFVSDSGRVVIEPDRNWMVAWALAYRHKEMPPDFEVTWRVVCQGTDELRFPPTEHHGVERTVTLAQGLSNDRHTLKLIPQKSTALPISGFRVYTPPLSESKR
jgi:hypothetical protein